MLFEDRFQNGHSGPYSLSGPADDGAWHIPEDVALFTSEFTREQFDLILTAEDGTALRLEGYFAAPTPADLLSADGAVLRGGVVERLAGPLFPAQYAQAGGVALADAIGQVETLVGVAFVQRTDGQLVELEIGTKVFQGDVVRTENGGTLGLTFADGTIFTLASGSRMVLDELIYDASASDNSGVFNLIEGSFVFIAGQAAKTGGIEINTPAATMGIRGTTGKIDIETVNGIATVTVSLNPDPDGSLGVIELRDLDGNLISNITGTETKWVIRPPFTNEPPIEISRDSLDLGADAPLLDQAVAAFQAAVNRVAQGETFVEFSEGDADPDVEDAPQEDAPDQPSTDEDTGDAPANTQPQFQEDETPEEAEPPRPAPLDETGEGTEGDGAPSGGTQELDGADDPLIDPQSGPQTEDEAALEPQEAPSGPDASDPGGPAVTPIDQGDGSTAGTRFADLEVQVTEDNALTSRLPIDSRTGDPVTVALAQSPSNGAVILSDDGTFTYTPDEDFEGTDTFVVSGQDETGALQTSEITVVVDPVNDAPRVSLRVVNAASVEEGNEASTGSGEVSGTLTYVDVDEGSTSGTWSISAASDNVTEFGTISIDATTGFWRYELDQGATDGLLDGEVFEETFIATVTDADGATDVSTVVIAVTGTNDSPVISVAVGDTSFTLLTGPDAQDGGGPGVITTGSVSGRLTYTDVDEGDIAATWSISADGGNETAFGTISIESATGAWRYDLPTDAPIPLGEGESVTEVYTAIVTDAGGATAAQAITISITGSSDAPTIIFSIEDVSATVFEAGFNPGTEGDVALRVAAPDNDLRLRQSEPEDASGSGMRARLDGGPDATGTLRYVDNAGNTDTATWSVAAETAALGSMTIDAVTGEWNYFLDESAADSLREGDEVIETFIATVTGPSGASASQLITITVRGSNDEAQLINAPEDLTGAVAEGGVATASGRLNFVDPDAAPGETASWSISADGDSRGSMVIDAATGQWTYTLDPDAAESLAAVGSVIETFTATVTDSFGATADQTVTITLTGENDAPVMASGSASLFKTDASVVIDLAALGSDIDDGEDGSTLIYAIIGAPSLGVATISGTDLEFATAEAFNGLGLDETSEVTIQVSATDASGETAINTIVITVTGSDTGPVITSSSAAALGNVVETGASISGVLSANGTLTYTDADAATATSGVWSIAPATSVFGAITIDAASGAWIYTLDDTAANSLNADDARVETFVATITDVDGLSAQQEITVTITGSNDAPTLSADSRTIGKATDSIAFDLTALASDVDAGDSIETLGFTIETEPTFGTATLTDGTLTFFTNGAFDDLAPGATRNDTIEVRVTDDSGASVTQTYQITVTGNNEAPVITSSTADANGAVTEAAGTSADGILPDASGQLTYTDADERAGFPATWSVVADTAAPLGRVEIVEDTGAWGYFLDQELADSLRQGTIVTETYTATVEDEFGATATQLMTMTITGSNDAPVVTVVTAQTTGATGTGGAATLTGQLEFTDVDVTVDDAVWSIARLPSGNTQEYGAMSIDAAGLWTYSANAAAIDSLPVGETRTESFRATITDEFGASDDIEVVITLTGSNVAPTITSGVTDARGTVAENTDADTGLATVSGQLTVVDPDETETTAAWSLTPISTVLLGSMSIGITDGAWTYALNDALSDSLDVGDTVIEEYLATFTDSQGATATQVLTITITGTNDAPTLTQSSAAVVDQNATLDVDLRALSDDVDADDAVTDLAYAIVSGDTKGVAIITGGTLSFDTDGQFNDLGAFETEDVVIRVAVTDPQGGARTEEITIRVSGENDAPVITSDPTDAAGAITEAGDIAPTPAGSVSGALTYTDSDEQAGTPATWSVDPATSDLGAITIDAATGVWEYTLDQAAADALNADEALIETFTATVTDAASGSATQLITITITGTNDRPTLNAGTLAATEDGGPVTLDLSTLSNDPDDENDPSNLIYSVDPSETAASIDGSILTFDPGSDFQDLAAGETREVNFNVAVEDDQGAAVRNGITVTITGANDAPTVPNFAGTLSENGGPITLDLDGVGVDIDTGAALEYSVITVPAKGFTQLLGTVVRFDPDGDFENLAVGQNEDIVIGYQARDNLGGVSEEGFITWTVQGENDGPTLAAATLAAVEDAGAVTLDLRTLGEDPDDGQDGNTLTYALDGAVTGASVTDGILTFDPGTGFQDLALNETRDVTINILASDGAGGEARNEITVTVTGVNDAPTLSSGALAATEDGSAVTLDLRTLGNDPDGGQDGTTLAYALDGVVSGATVSNGILTFDPGAGFQELAEGETTEVVVDITATDAQSGTASGSVIVTITGVNDDPTLGAGTLNAVEDGDAVTLDLRALADDPDNGQDASTLTFALDGAVDGASVSNGILTFDPGTQFQDLALGETRDVTVDILVTDADGGTAGNTVTVTVTGVNDGPTLTAGTLAATEDAGVATLDLDTLSTDTDTGSTLSYTLTGAVAGASISNGILSYDVGTRFQELAVSETQDVAVEIEVSDAEGGTATNTVTVTVTGVNDAPTLAAGTLNATEDGGAVTLDLRTLGADVDSDDDANSLIYDIEFPLGGPAIPATVDAGILTYNPGSGFQTLAAGETAEVVLNISAMDQNSVITDSTVTVTIAGVNDAPTLAAGALNAAEDGGAVTLDLRSLGDDTDSNDNANTLSYRLDGEAPNVGVSAGILTFNPDTDFQDLALGETRDIVVDILAEDSASATTAGIVTVTVTGTNDDPTLGAGTLAAIEDLGAVTLDLSTLGADVDSDDNAASLVYTLGVFSGAGGNPASIDGSILTYDPGTRFQTLGAGETQDVTVNIVATDRHGASVDGTVTVTVTGRNDSPTLEAGTMAVTEDGAAVTLDLDTLGGDIDAGQADTLTYTLLTPSTEASITNNILTYDIGTGFQGLAEGEEQDVILTVQAEDTSGGMVTNMVTVTVTGVNDTAFLADASAMVNEADTTSTFINLSGLLSDADDGQDGTTKTYQIVTGVGASEGIVTVDGLGVRYDPNGDFSTLAADETVDVSFTVRARDPGVADVFSNTATVTVTVTGANDAPDAQDFTVNHDGDAGAISIDALAQVVDTDDTEFTLVSVGAAGAGTAVIDDMGTVAIGDDVILYTPDVVTDGTPDTFTYTVRDGAGNLDTGTITVNVPENTAPSASDTAISLTLTSRAGASFSADSGGWYEFVRGYYTWDEAQIDAANKGGYLAVLTSADENETAAELVSAASGDIDAWLGASDAGTEGEWFWTEAPGGSQQFWTGTSTGNTVNGLYENWFEGQPNSVDAGANDHLSLMRFGEAGWDDVNENDPRGYLLELGNVVSGGTLNGVNVINLDASDALTFSLSESVAGLTLSSDGSYNFDPTTDAYAALDDGETTDVVVQYTVTDERGASDTANLTITFAGANDAPTVVDETASVTTVVGGSALIGTGWVEWAAGSGGNGHYYKLFSDGTNYGEAVGSATAVGGYLATITSAEENAFLTSMVAPNTSGRIGGSDAVAEGDWRWIGGPEADQQFWQGTASGNSVGGLYTNWEPGEPRTLNADISDDLFFNRDGSWSALSAGTRTNHYTEFDQAQFATGNVATNDSDPEGGAITYALSGSYAGLTLASDGTWQFDRADAAYSGLGASDSVTINAYYIATDAGGATSDGRLQITVTGNDSNGAPILGSDNEEITLSIDPGPSGAGWSEWGVAAGGNGHFYQYITGAVNFSEALANASALGGHLATITSAGEQSFIDGLQVAGSQSVGWLGGSDAAVDGEWRWIEGPETGDQFWQGVAANNPVTPGSAVNGAYTNWTESQPDGGEDALHTFGDGKWNDNTPADVLNGYYLEYSGLPLRTGSIAGNDNDPDGDPITYTATNVVAGLTLDSAGNWTFDRADPAYSYIAAGDSDVVSLTYTADDGNGGTTDGTFDITLQGVNDAPVLAEIAVNFGTVSETAATQVLDLITGATDPDNGDVLEVNSFTYFWSSDIPGTPAVSPMGGTTLQIAPSDLSDLGVGQSATLNMTYNVSDGTVNVARTATFTVTGAFTPISAASDNLSPAGASTALTSEDIPASIAATTLLANDNDPEGLGLSIISVTGFQGINTIGYSQRAGALLTLSSDGSQIFYNPTHSAALNDLDTGQSFVDNFYYTIESGDGLQQSTAEVAFSITGVGPSGDADPIAFAVTGSGLGAGVTNRYDVNPLFMQDDDAGTGMVYKIAGVQGGSVDELLPDYLKFDPDIAGAATGPGLTVDKLVFNGGSARVNNLALTGFEADGDYTSSPFTLVLDDNGDIRYTKYGFGDADGITALVELGVEPGVVLGDIADGVDFDLSGLDVLTPNTLRDLEVLQIQNSQENDLTIDSDDLLALIDGNAANANERIQITADVWDNVSFATSSDWAVSMTDADIAVITGVSGAFAGLGVMATMDLDGANFVPS